ncbi:MAG: hypothetical protein N4A33_05275 [Bacteriovoracaceae bacterium]|jgi:hypothetical protein|nr:hypothetical protein [Bacteriovoracaceae bacterium]
MKWLVFAFLLQSALACKVTAPISLQPNIVMKALAKVQKEVKSPISIRRISFLGVNRVRVILLTKEGAKSLIWNVKTDESCAVTLSKSL